MQPTQSREISSARCRTFRDKLHQPCKHRHFIEYGFRKSLVRDSAAGGRSNFVCQVDSG